METVQLLDLALSVGLPTFVCHQNLFWQSHILPFSKSYINYNLRSIEDNFPNHTSQPKHINSCKFVQLVANALQALKPAWLTKHGRHPPAWYAAPRLFNPLKDQNLKPVKSLCVLCSYMFQLTLKKKEYRTRDWSPIIFVLRSVDTIQRQIIVANQF